MSKLSCSKCGSEAVVSNGAVVKTCECKNVSIIANMSATAYGSASLAMNPPNKIEIALSRVLDLLGIRRV